MNSTICLNLHFDNSLCCEYPRLGDYFANKKFVLSEKMYNAQPFIDGKEYVSFYEGQLSKIVDQYLNNSNELSCIANNAYQKFSKFSLTGTIDLLLMPLLLEKYNRGKFDYRLLNRLFHRIGIEAFKDSSHPIYMFNSNLRRYIANIFR